MKIEGDFRRRINKELKELYKNPGIVQMVRKQSQMSENMTKKKSETREGSTNHKLDGRGKRQEKAEKKSSIIILPLLIVYCFAAPTHKFTLYMLTLCTLLKWPNCLLFSFIYHVIMKWRDYGSFWKTTYEISKLLQWNLPCTQRSQQNIC